jgi:hypothetical protein
MVAIEKSFTEGAASFMEILFPLEHMSDRLEFMKRMASIERRRGDYSGYLLNVERDSLMAKLPFANFTIVFDGHGGSQVFLGWSLGTNYSMGHKSFIFTDGAVAEYFMAHALALMPLSTRIAGSRTP